MSAINEQQHVTPYFYVPTSASEAVCLGIKISPPEGIKLRVASRVENTKVEYIDIVMAYRLEAEWEGRLLRSVRFLGAQPAFHDATERHRLWNDLESKKRTEVMQFLSHAFQTPITNIKAVVRELRTAKLTDYYQRRSEQLFSYVEDLSHLSNLLVFISTSDRVKTSLRCSDRRNAGGPESIRVEEIKTEIAGTLRSILSGRTRNPLNERKIQTLLGLSGAPGGKAKRVTDKTFRSASERIINL